QLKDNKFQSFYEKHLSTQDIEKTFYKTKIKTKLFLRNYKPKFHQPPLPLLPTKPHTFSPTKTPQSNSPSISSSSKPNFPKSPFLSPTNPPFLIDQSQPNLKPLFNKYTKITINYKKEIYRKHKNKIKLE
nr:hypothetical protein 7 - Trypanosoma brucei mitochondrion [Trypanosoma brucei]